MLNSVLTSSLTVGTFLLCTAVSLALGIGTACLARFRSHISRGFALTLAVLPAMVQAVILLVNGSVGAGVAVAGAFSLVRFRSAPGSAREIASIFLAMALGLATGMGYLTLAVLFFCIMAVFILLLTACNFGGGDEEERELKITIPENLDYDGLFDDLFETYTRSVRLDKVKTASMGTLYELHYRVRLKGTTVPKEFLDALRCRNGNLTISCGRVDSVEAL